MPVIPYRTNLFQTKKDLYQFLLTCQTSGLVQTQPQIASISFALQPVDPLAVLQCLHTPNRLHFYLEKRQGWGSLSVQEPSVIPGVALSPAEGSSLAIVGMDAAVQFQTQGCNRFTAAQRFIDSCLIRTLTVGELQLPFAGPHFFCSFTFFDHGDRFPGATVFLPRWQVAHQGNQSVLVANVPLETHSDLSELTEEVWQTLQTINALPTHPLGFNPSHGQRLRPLPDLDIHAFRDAVLSALKSIQMGAFNKIVLAHAFEVEAPQPFEIFASLHNLRQCYPDCYVFSVSNEAGQIFMGASPERLLKIVDYGLTTDALAGSAPRGQTPREDARLAKALLHSSKDQYEHQVVTDFITQCLTQLGLQPQLSSAPHLLQLPNIQHLRTIIHAHLPRQLHLLEILAALHPTPAVAGAPRKITSEHIRQYETFERDLFGAPLGWVDYQGNGEFIVGIRSALIDRQAARLYAGAGIVAASDPDKEVAEIGLKLQALLNALS